jgi:Leucine-rich repeat (LRR) protein
MEFTNLNNLFAELTILENLHTLKVTNMKLETFRLEWRMVLRNLSYLSLASNNLRYLNSDLFKYSPNLISLDLNQNNFLDLNDLFNSLKPLEKNLKELKLSSNLISQVPQSPKYEQLELLDLSNNQINNLNNNTFEKLTKLNYLHLSSNKLTQLSNNMFDNMENLLILVLNNNYLSKFPNITKLNKLQILDMTNQNGLLKVIPDYAFERIRNDSYSLNVILDSNDLVKFGSKAFCSRYSTNSQINNINLSYRTMKNLNKCQLKQLKTDFVSRVSLKVQQNENIIDYSDVCNCDLKLLASSFNIDLVGICGTLNNACANNKLIDMDCMQKFEC